MARVRVQATYHLCIRVRVRVRVKATIKVTVKVKIEVKVTIEAKVRLRVRVRVSIRVRVVVVASDRVSVGSSDTPVDRVIPNREYPIDQSQERGQA